MNRRWPWSIVLTAVIAVMVCPRAPAQDVAAGMRVCAKQADDAARLKCYDTEMQRLRETPTPPAPGKFGLAKPPEPAPDVPELTAEQAFGYRGTIARGEVDRRNEMRDTLERLESVVTKVERKPLGEFVLTLENGQVWMQKSPDGKFRLKAGDAVTIRRASLGSFLMSVQNGRSTQVARVR